jgi:flagellar hook-associated protein 2
VSAQVVNTGLPGAPSRLEISANSTGAANAFTVSSSLTGGAAPDFTNTEVGPVSLDSVAGSAAPSVGGTYTGTLSQAYHFSVSSGGTVGTDPLTIAYTSDSGESGTTNIPADYTAGSPLAIADGLTLTLGAGTLNADDKFSVGVFTPALSTAQNAQVQVGNQIVSSQTNAVTNAIAGVTLNLAGKGGPSTVTVNQDISSESRTVSAFVNTFNALLTGVSSMTRAQPGRQAPALANNGGLEAMMQNLSESLCGINLSTLGISIDHKSGQLQFDSGTFSANTIANPSTTATALTAIANALNPAVTSVLAPSTGLIASATTSLQGQITDQTAKIAQLQNQATQQQDALTAEYATLQAQVLQYQNIQLLLDNQGSSSGSSSSAAVGSGLTVNG